MTAEEEEIFCELVGKFVFDAEMTDKEAQERAYKEVFRLREQKKSTGDCNYRDADQRV